MANLVASPLGPSQGFNYIFLIELLVCGILSLFFLFYFNRLFATVVSYGIRAYTWHKYRAYIDITALQISLLGGRIFFKSVRYHAHNITVLVHDGHITWQYWLRQVQEAEIFNTSPAKSSAPEASGSDLKEKHDGSPDQVEAGQKQKKELPCRISVKVSGVEAFIYNRSPLYDGIVEATLKRAQQQTDKQDATSDDTKHYAQSGGHHKEALHQSNTHSTSADSSISRPLDVPQWLRMLPVRIRCKRAAAAIGNQNTTSVLTAKVEQTVGQIDASAASSTLDLYKLLFNFEFKKVDVAMKPNKDYKSPQATTAHVALRKNVADHKTTHHRLPFLRRRKAWLPKWLPRFAIGASNHESVRAGSRASTTGVSVDNLPDSVPGKAQWHGLTRYLSEDTSDEHAEWRGGEYAKATTLVNCQQVNMRFHWDIPGSDRAGNNEDASLLNSDTGTDSASSSSPDYGIDLAVHGGFVVYGPWADRERVNLQRIFFPASCVDAAPQELPRAGETRLATVFKLFLSIEEDVTLRIPTRETSKDYKWRGRANKRTQKQEASNKTAKSGRRKKPKEKTAAGGMNVDIRPYGWLDVTVKPNSTVNYSMDMYARKTGFHNAIDLDIKGTEITSSVNHALLWRAGALTLEADLSNPLSWNTLRAWPFKIVCDAMELFILRDHLFLIIDLVDDWGAGSVPDFYTFVPFRYTMDITFRNFVMYLNTNDANIINDPADFNTNDFLTLEGEVLHGVLGIPLLNYRPKKNEITFDVDAQNLSMRMLSSTRNTIKTLLEEKRLARLPKLSLLGSYESNQEQSRGLTDTLRMDIEGTGFSIQAYGFLLRHLINIKENYFGDFAHFQTLEEFQDAGEDMLESNAQTTSQSKPKPVNELDVLLSIVIKEAEIMFPTNLYTTKEYIRAEVPEALVDLRVSSYYLDLAVNLSPISIQIGSMGDASNSPVSSSSNIQLYISHTSVHGHRAFGLSPAEATYASTWEIDIGAVTGEMRQRFLHDAVLAAKSLIFTFADKENALPLDPPDLIFDTTFVQVRTDTLRVWLHAGDEALLLSADPITVHSNDWANETFSQHVNVLVPNLTIACVDASSAIRARASTRHKHVAKTYAFFQTTVALNLVGRKKSFVTEAQKQQAYMRCNDLRTRRIPFLLRTGDFWQQATTEELPSTDPPAMIYPPFPRPVTGDGHARDQATSVKSVPVVRLPRKTSIASLSSSIRNARLAVPGVSGLIQSRSPSTTTQHSARSRLSSSNRSITTSEISRSVDNHQACFSPATIAFTSMYGDPYFPLNTVVPDETVAPAYGTIKELSNTSIGSSIASGDDDETIMEDEVAQDTITIDFLPGIRAYAEPHMAQVALHLMEAIQPKSAVDVMDTFQQDVMADVAERNQRKHVEAKITQIGVNLPSLAARVHHSDPACAPVMVELTLDALRFKSRIRSATERHGDGSLSFHVLLGSLRTALYQNPDQDNPTMTAKLILEDILLWIAFGKAKNIYLSMAQTSIDLVASASTFLTALPQSLMPLSTQLKQDITGQQIRAKQRLQLLLYQLTQLGEHVGDPPFLTKMTYILRAFPDHFRNQESWKVIMRFRNILQSLPSAILRDMEQTFQKKDISCPADAPHKMLESWTQWRNWDVINVEHTEAFQKILEKSDDSQAQTSPLTPICLTWIQEGIRLTIKDAAHDSHVALNDLRFGIKITPPLPPTGLMLVEDNTRTKILSHTHASSVSIELQWNLMSVVEKILPQILQRLPPSEQNDTERSTTQALEDEITRQEWHVIVTTDAGSVALHTHNLHHIAEAEGLKLSFIGTTQAEEPYGVCASVLLNADRAGTQLHANSSMIWQSLLISPSIYIDHLRPRKGADIPPIANVAVGYREIQLSVTEPIPGILRTVDSVIAEEVAQILQLVHAIDRQQVDRSNPLELLQKTLSGGSNKIAKIHVALLAGELTVEVSLLQSLKYRLTGKAASMRIAPNLHEEHVMSIDFETGKLYHSFINISRGEEHQQRIVDVPPISGHLVLRNAADSKKLSVMATVGRLEIDAEALQAVATTLGKTEVQSFITAIKDGIVEIQERVDEVVPPKATSRELDNTTNAPPLHYEVQVSLTGVRVAASTAQTSTRAVAAFEIGIGACNAIASNEKSIQLGDAPLVPEVRATLRDIGAKLTVREGKKVHPAGNITLTLALNFSADRGNDGQVVHELAIRSQRFEVNAYPETAAITVDVINHLQDRLKHLDLSNEMEYIRSLRSHKKVVQSLEISKAKEPSSPGLSPADLLTLRVKVELTDVVVTWLVHNGTGAEPEAPIEDLVLTLAAIELSTQGVREGRLSIRDLQLQLVARGQSKAERTVNSALLPEIVFTLAYWTGDKDSHLAFKATGKPLDLRLDSRFVLPFAGVKHSIDYAVEKFRAETADWKEKPTASGVPRQNLLGSNHFASLTAEAEFAGAQFYLRGAASPDLDFSSYSPGARGMQHGRYGQFAAEDGVMRTMLRSPGISLKLQYENKQTSTIQAEILVAPSSNMLLPNVVPLVIEISRSVKEVMQNQDKKGTPHESVASTKLPQSTMFDEALATADPTAIFGKTKINLGLRIARQEFGLTCQPIAKIDAKAELDDFYLTVSTIDDTELGRFFSVSASLCKVSARVKHVYSREPTFSFDMDSVILSLMNNKHFSGVNGISAILKINPTRTSINGKQLQDLLLFREIWLPPEIRNAAVATAAANPQSPESVDVLMHRYQIAASAAAFPWNATISISELCIDLELGQSLGKSSFKIANLWASSQKTSSAEQNLCIGLDEIAMNSQGRMSGFINLSKLAVRTLIRWPEQNASLNKTPRIQASIGFGRMRAKAAFDYQAFAFGDIEGFDFVMYNVSEQFKHTDRLVAILDCAKAYVFCTSTSPAQALSLYQAVNRLIQEKQAAFGQSLKEIEKHLRRESAIIPSAKPVEVATAASASPSLRSPEDRAPVTLNTDVVVSLGNICVGAFPGTFFDSQIFKVEANNLEARFAVGLEKGKVRSGLGMTIGQLQVALAAVKKMPVPKNISDLGVDEVIGGALEGRGGVILKVPRVVASMETWQIPKSTQIEYIFKSLFEGKVDIGWNLSRINLIRGMWNTHSRALASRMGKPLPASAVKITADLEEKSPSSELLQQRKITAEVNLPQSRYEYLALEPPIIETPQLRDMGEATPPLEWIGLHRDRLPNITHQIIIVALLEVAKEVEDAYGRILGTS